MNNGRRRSCSHQCWVQTSEWGRLSHASHLGLQSATPGLSSSWTGMTGFSQPKYNSPSKLLHMKYYLKGRVICLRYSISCKGRVSKASVRMTCKEGYQLIGYRGWPTAVNPSCCRVCDWFNPCARTWNDERRQRMSTMTNSDAQWNAAHTQSVQHT